MTYSSDALSAAGAAAAVVVEEVHLLRIGDTNPLLILRIFVRYAWMARRRIAQLLRLLWVVDWLLQGKQIRSRSRVERALLHILILLEAAHDAVPFLVYGRGRFHVLVEELFGSVVVLECGQVHLLQSKTPISHLKVDARKLPGFGRRNRPLIGLLA